MNIIGMLPSEVEGLKAAEPTSQLKDDLLQSIAALVNADAGRDETVFLAARNLSKAGLPRFVDPQALAEVIENGASTATQQFLKGLAPDYAGKVAIELLAVQNAMEPDEGQRAVLNYGVLEVPIVPSVRLHGFGLGGWNVKASANPLRAAPGRHGAFIVVNADGNIVETEVAAIVRDDSKPVGSLSERVGNRDS